MGGIPCNVNGREVGARYRKVCVRIEISNRGGVGSVPKKRSDICGEAVLINNLSARQVARRIQEGGLLLPFKEIAWSSPLKAIPTPPRTTIRSLYFDGLQANPSCGPKFVLSEL